MGAKVYECVLVQATPAASPPVSAHETSAPPPPPPLATHPPIVRKAFPVVSWERLDAERKEREAQQVSLVRLQSVMSDPSNFGVYPTEIEPRTILVFAVVPPENLMLEGHAQTDYSNCVRFLLGLKPDFRRRAVRRRRLPSLLPRLPSLRRRSTTARGSSRRRPSCRLDFPESLIAKSLPYMYS